MQAGDEKTQIPPQMCPIHAPGPRSAGDRMGRSSERIIEMRTRSGAEPFSPVDKSPPVQARLLPGARELPPGMPNRRLFGLSLSRSSTSKYFMPSPPSAPSPCPSPSPSPRPVIPGYRLIPPIKTRRVAAPPTWRLSPIFSSCFSA